MKRLITLILTLILFVACVMMTACNGESLIVKKAYVNDEGHIIVEYSNGSSQDFGKIENVGTGKTIVDTEVNAEKHLIVTYNDGTTEDLGYVGVEIVKQATYEVDDKKHLIVTYPNGTSEDLGYVGVEIEIVEKATYAVDNDKHLIATYPDGTTEDLGYVGVEIVKQATYEVDDKKHLIVTYPNGTSEDLGYVGVEIEIVEKATYAVDNDKHLIATYPDGTTEDLGYVGVEVKVPSTPSTPSVYVVTFVDVDGNELSKQQVYEGLSAFAPEAPSIKNKVFAGWSKDFTNVQSNLTVQATYTKGQTYIVKFVDINGNEIKSQEVYAGESATAPNAPTIVGKVFDGWDKSFTNVNSNITVQATYREARDCVVTFKDYSGIVLGTANVKEGGNVTAPIIPSREGYTFKGWSSSLNNVTGDKTVIAEYTLNSGNNIFDIAYKVNGNSVTVTLSLAGTVCLAGFEGTLTFEGMNVVNATAKSNYALINTNGNSVKMTYSNATNVTRGEVVLEVTLTKTADNGNATLNLTDCFDQNFTDVNYKVIGQNIKLK